MPAAIDSMRVAPQPASARHASSAPPGFTATTPDVHARGASTTVTPGSRAPSADRRSSLVSTTTIEPGCHPARTSPATMAAPMLPPPMNWMPSPTVGRLRPAADQSAKRLANPARMSDGKARSTVWYSVPRMPSIARSSSRSTGTAPRR